MSNNRLVNVLLSVFFCFVAYNTVVAQHHALSSVLNKNQIGKEFVFDSSSKANGYDKVYIKYLGRIKTGQSDGIKILTYARIWGKNKHTTGIIFIYDLHNKFLGKYHLGSSNELPQKIKMNYLIFTNERRSDCDSKTVTKIDFSKGLKNEIFLKCKGSSGDIYSLSTDE